MTAIQQIHVGRRELRLDEDTYRDLLVRVTGKASLKLMSDSEHRRVIEDMRAKGFKPSAKSGKRPLSGRYSKKAQALWLSLWNLGAVEDRRDSALIEFGRRQTKVDHIDWLKDPKAGSAVVDALKKWAEREGVDWSPTRDPIRGAPGFRVALAQAGKLGIPTGPEFWNEVAAVLKRSVLATKPTDAEWIVVMNALGKRVRALAKGSTTE